ncbi:MAG: Flp family type IVb pilin [Candidatus Hydrothermales bacterium]
MKRLIYNEKGATAVEYAMIIGLIALFAFAAYRVLGREVHKVIVWMRYKLMTVQAGPE